MPTFHEAPEVRAARARGAEILPVPAPVNPDIDTLLTDMIDADEVYIDGVLPWECCQRLIALQQRGVDAGRPPPTKIVHYFIPERDPKNIGTTMGPRIQRWIAGLFGVRNWVVPHRHDDANRNRLVVRLLRDDAGTRTVLTRKGDLYRATSIGYHPGQTYPAAALITVAGYDPEQTEKIRKRILDELVPTCPVWEIRQVRCYGPQYEETGDANSFTPRVWRLTRDRKLQPPETEPAVVVAVCGQTWDGPVVMLKRRHQSNAIDDFDRLSLVSEHVIAEDLVTWVRRVPQPLDPDDTRAREQIWRAAGRPDRLILEQQFFEEAAQRELFLSCGLNVDFGRLDFCGYRLVDREDGRHLGFAVFRLDLVQDDALDELEIVEKWSVDMRPILLTRLYDDPSKLNGLLRLQRAWLQENVFSRQPSKPPNGIIRPRDGGGE